MSNLYPRRTRTRRVECPIFDYQELNEDSSDFHRFSSCHDIMYHLMTSEFRNRVGSHGRSIVERSLVLRKLTVGKNPNVPLRGVIG